MPRQAVAAQVSFGQDHMSARQLGQILIGFGISMVCAFVVRWIAQRLGAGVSVRYNLAYFAGVVLPILVSFFVFRPVEFLDFAGPGITFVLLQMLHSRDARIEEEGKGTAAKE